MNVMRAHNRASSRVRGTSPRSITANEEFTHLWHVENLSHPTEVHPGSNVPVSFEVYNHEGFHDPFNPNTCAPNLEVGSRIDAVLLVDGTVRSRNWECVRGDVSQPYRLSFLAGSDGTVHDVAIELRNQHTQEANTRVEFQIDVTDDAPDGECPPGFVKEGNDCVPEDDGNGNGGGTGPLLPCFIDPNTQCSPFESGAYMIAGLFMMLFMFSVAT